MDAKCPLQLPKCAGPSMKTPTVGVVDAVDLVSPNCSRYFWQSARTAIKYPDLFLLE
jgi:hypothetical protein